MKVNTTRFGVLEVDEQSIVRMPKGPLGFEEWTEFCLIQHRPDIPFRWLQSTTEPSLAFVVVDPSEYFSDYEIEISDADAEKLRLASAGDALVLVIVTLGEGATMVTGNLAAPIVINSRELTGMQVVLQDGRYTVRHALVAASGQKSVEETVVEAA